MFLLSISDGGLYWLERLVDLILQLIPSIGTALFTAWFLDKAFKKSKKLGEDLAKSGIDHIEYASGKMSKKDRSKLFGLNGKTPPTEVSLCFLTGDNFFLDYYNYILDLQKRGTKIRVIIANPFDCERAELYLKNYPENFSRENSLCKEEHKKAIAEHYYAITKLDSEGMQKLAYLERTFLMVSREAIDRVAENKFGRKYEHLDEFEKQQAWYARIPKTGDHIMQVMIVTKIVNSLNEACPENKIELAYYKDEYRIPITLAKFKKCDEEEYYLWTNMNAPVKETTKSVNLVGRSEEASEANYVTDVINTFNYLFNRYKK